MDYKSYIDKLEGISNKSIYQYSEDPLSSIFECYFQFIINAITKVSDELRIPNCYFYFKDSTSNDARAINHTNGNKYIEIYQGLVNSLHTTFKRKKERIKNLDEAKILAEKITTSIDELMFNSTAAFLFYHEFGHIIQFNGNSSIDISEAYSTTGSQYNILDHATEIDSDEFAANYLASHLLLLFDNNFETSNSKALQALAILCITSIFILFEKLSGGINFPINYNEGKHPHAAIRVTGITGIIAEKLSATHKFNNQEIIRRSYEVIDYLLGDDYPRQSFIEILKKERNLIVKYFSSTRKERDKYDWMAGMIFKKKKLLSHSQRK